MSSTTITPTAPEYPPVDADATSEDEDFEVIAADQLPNESDREEEGDGEGSEVEVVTKVVDDGSGGGDGDAHTQHQNPVDTAAEQKLLQQADGSDVDTPPTVEDTTNSKHAEAVDENDKDSEQANHKSIPGDSQDIKSPSAGTSDANTKQLGMERDSLLAKVVGQQDLVEYQSELIKNLKLQKAYAGSGSYSAELILNHKKEIDAKDAVIKDLHQQLDKLELEHKQEVDRGNNLQAIVDVLQEEQMEARRHMKEQRNSHRSEVGAMQQQINDIYATLRNAGAGGGGAQAATSSSCQAQSRSPPTVAPAERHVCERCHLSMTSREQYNQHVAGCQPRGLRVEQCD